jgi:cytochrome c biogenesis protein
MASIPLDTRAATQAISEPPLGPLGLGRWAWRQLTSMRTALFLLLLLAVASVPGSIWPQRNIDAGRVSDYLDQHRTLGPWMDRLGIFEVYSSPWFSAIYLLLSISLIGCVVPRSRTYWRTVRARPPRAPIRLERLPEHRELLVDAPPERVRAVARQVLADRRFRVHAHDETSLSAESGHLRETGNLAFHAAMVLVVVAIAVGHLFGWRGDVIVPEAETFSSTVSAYGTINPGPWVDTTQFAPFSVRIDSMSVSFEESATGAQRGAPREFTAVTTTRDNPDAPPVTRTLSVNSPLHLGGASVFLLGNGYAPVITVRDPTGTVVYREATPFLAQDNNYRSVGAVKVSGMAAGKQLGLAGLFLPTWAVDPDVGPISTFPALNRPALALTLWEGELFPGGRPQNVYRLSTEKMTQLTSSDGQPVRIWLTPGATVQLPGGRGTITMDRVRRFAGLSVRHDPGKALALVGSMLALTGLLVSLSVRRRRVFVRVRPAPDLPGACRTILTVGGIAKGEDSGLTAAIDTLVRSIDERTGKTT